MPYQVLHRRSVLITLTILLTIACGERPRYGSQEKQSVVGLYNDDTKAASSEMYEDMSLSEFEFLTVKDRDAGGKDADVSRLVHRANDAETGDLREIPVGEFRKNGGMAYHLTLSPGLATATDLPLGVQRLRDLGAGESHIRAIVQNGKLVLTAGARAPLLWSKTSKEAMVQARGKIGEARKLIQEERAKFLELTHDAVLRLTQYQITKRVRAVPIQEDEPAAAAPPTELAGTPPSRLTPQQRQAWLQQQRQQPRKPQPRANGAEKAEDPVTTIEITRDSAKAIPGGSDAKLKILVPKTLKILNEREALINDTYKASVSLRLLKDNRAYVTQDKKRFRLMIEIIPEGLNAKEFSIEESTFRGIVSVNAKNEKGFIVVDQNDDPRNEIKRVVYSFEP